MAQTTPTANTEPSAVSERLQPFGTTIFAEMTRLAIEHNAVNLSQGFPDFDGPDAARSAAAAAIGAGHNQYARTFGVPPLVEALAARWTARTGLPIEPDRMITVTSGCTEAIAAALFGLTNPGDEVVVFEPFYDSYRACIAMAGAVPRFVTLRPRDDGFHFDEAQLRAAFTSKTRAILLNTPHNPTGKVFTRGELELIASLCREHDVIAITDEVYEDLTFDAALPHISLATLPGMAERTVTLSSLGKSFSLTGWKIGWAIAPPRLTAGVRSAHQFLTFATATPLQHGAAAILRDPGDAITGLVSLLRRNRDDLAAALTRIGLKVYPSPGTYFIMADHSAVSAKLGLADDRAFCRHLIEHAGVAAIPPSVFYAHPEEGRSLVRFAFCKKPETIAAAMARLEKLA